MVTMLCLLRVRRRQILAVFRLVTLRNSAALIKLPLGNGVLPYLCGFLFLSAQTAVLVAVPTSLFNIPCAVSILSSLFNRLPASLDGKFIKLYSLLSLTGAQLAAAAQTDVVFYDLMRPALNTEHTMYVSS